MQLTTNLQQTQSFEYQHDQVLISLPHISIPLIIYCSQRNPLNREL